MGNELGVGDPSTTRSHMDVTSLHGLNITHGVLVRKLSTNDV